MNIEKIKSTLLSAIDSDQKKILILDDVYTAIKLLRVFPMTLEILNSSRIGKLLNDIRHFNETNDDIKNLLKNLIKEWQIKLVKSNQPKKLYTEVKHNTNGSHRSLKSPESLIVLPNHTIGISDELQKSFHSSNNIEILSGHKKNIVDCDKSYEIPLKKAKYVHGDSCPKTFLNETSKFQQKENHFENKSIPNSIAQTKSLSSIDKTRKRKNDVVSNCSVNKLPKVKSTLEILNGVSDSVANDTKKKIIGNEIIFEEDTPRSCIPESYKSRIKSNKPTKSAQSNKILNGTIKTSPKVSNCTNDKFLNHSPKSEIIKDEKFISHSNSINRNSSPYLYNSKDSMPSSLIKSKPPNDTKYIKIKDKKVSLKLKIAVKHINPPVTNRMDEIPNLEPIDPNMTLTFDEYLPKVDRGETQLTYAVADRLAHSNWDGYNMTVHPITKQNVPFNKACVVKGLIILPYTDQIFESKNFFPENTKDELSWLINSISDNVF